MRGFRAKLGLRTKSKDDESLAKNFLDLLVREQVAFTLAFRRLAEISGPEPEASVRDIFDFDVAFGAWLKAWQARGADEDFPGRQTDMLKTNPAIIPRNHLVEEAIQAALDGDFSVFETLNRVLANPFSLKNTEPKFTLPPRPDQMIRETFCGT